MVYEMSEHNKNKILNTLQGIDELKLNICGEHKFDWIDTNLADFFVIECIDERGKLLLDFLYEYYKMGNEEDYFWCEYEWYFDFETIKKIKEEEPFDELWAHRPPK